MDREQIFHHLLTLIEVAQEANDIELVRKLLSEMKTLVLKGRNSAD